MRLESGACGAVSPHGSLEQECKHGLGTCSLETQTIGPSPDPLSRDVWGSRPSRQRFCFTTDLQDCGSSSCTVPLYITKWPPREAQLLPAAHCWLHSPRWTCISSPRRVCFKLRVCTSHLASPTSFIPYLPPLWQPPLDFATGILSLLYYSCSFLLLFMFHI